MKLVNINQVAEMLDVTPRTIRAYVAAGVLPAFKLPGKIINTGEHTINRGSVRFDLEAVTNALNRYAVNAPRQEHSGVGLSTAPSKQ